MPLEFGIFDHVDRHDQPLAAFYEDRLKLACRIVWKRDFRMGITFD